MAPDISEIAREVFRAENIDGTPDVRFYEMLIAAIQSRRLVHDGTFVLGICGTQGSGKSTLARVLKEAFEQLHGLSVAVLSLDDLYLSSSARARLGAEVHPLLRTRGVPGTHDIALGMATIAQLSKTNGATLIPRFDKALDEPKPRERWEEFRGRADIVIFEGWCVGAVSQTEAELTEPLNTLEGDEDADGRWRRFVNAQLAGPYRALFAMLNALVMIRAPSFDVVFGWRQEQERKLRTTAGNLPHVMDDAALRRFISHYERLTRHILAEMPSRADVVIALDENRKIAGVSGA